MIKILLVEDNAVDACLTQDILTEWGREEFNIVHVTRLSDAVTHLARVRFDAILLDLSLPDGYGLSTVRQIQAANPTIAVIVLSGLDDQKLALQAVQNGAQDYLVKGQGQPELLARSIRYAIERKRAEERLTYLAQYDQLTGLVNRTLFRDRLVQAMARSKRLQQPLGLMLLDLDQFKPVNDTMGHNVGDLLLKAVAERLQECVREVDTVARMGGDEFTIILEGLTCEEDITLVAQRITTSLAEPFDLGEHKALIGVSIGITVYPTDDQEVDELLKHADAAMYRAKQQGGSSFQFHIPDDLPPPPIETTSSIPPGLPHRPI
jgi:two-component system cell cycle response regulator